MGVGVDASLQIYDSDHASRKCANTVKTLDLILMMCWQGNDMLFQKRSSLSQQERRAL